MIKEKKTKAVHLEENKAIQPAENKELEKVVEQFLFPAQDGFPAIIIWAKNIEEATKKYIKERVQNET